MMQLVSCRLFLLAACAGMSVSVFADEGVRLAASLDTSKSTENEYQITIAGQIITPSPDGPQNFSLSSTGQFAFRQQAVANDATGASTIRAVRVFSTAMTSTTVDKNHVTKVGLPSAYRKINVVGSNDGLVCYSPKYLIPRSQLDLIQMPFDPLAMNSLLPSGSVTVGDKWNTPDWLMPMLTGIETAIEQSTSCSLKSLDEEFAVIQFTGKISGAVRGSAANVTYSGDFKLDRKLGLITSFLGQQKEKRTPGPVSPGLDVTADIQWTTKHGDSTIGDLPELPEEVPSKNLQLVLQTPLRMQIQHSREWFMFHETPNLLMMRQLRSGKLVSQCNIAPGIAVAPGQHSTDKEFLSDVLESVRKQNGKVSAEKTIRDDSSWRIRQVRAVGDSSGNRIYWDHYLCTAKSGEQFSFTFSYTEDDEKLFGDEAERILASMQLVQKRPTLPFR